ncbi:kinase-like domain-containing protein [Amanita rubescens]|nr:kinase-like domain-containing protein [Amanita rubescens]
MLCNDQTNLKEESRDAGYRTIIEPFAAPDLLKQIEDSELMEDDQTKILKIMQECIADHEIDSDKKREAIAKNLYKLLRASKQLLPRRQLGAREVKWSDQESKGKFLHSEYVKIKVIRSANMKNNSSIQRISHEVESWAKIYERDQGEYILPFYGFYSPDGLRIALVSPWMHNGDALTYVMHHDKDVNYYRKLILDIAKGIKVLHDTNPVIVHGNLRAKNILIGDKGQPLITDYALAKFDGELITLTTRAPDGCRWCAPEVFQLDGEATVSTAGDIYSFGMTILELLTHEMPYTSIRNNLQVVAMKQENQPPDRPQDERVIERGLDQTMWDLLCRCWSEESTRIDLVNLIDAIKNLPPLPAGDTNTHAPWATKTKRHIQPKQKRHSDPPRLTDIVSELTTNDDVTKKKQIDLLSKLLCSSDHHSISSSYVQDLIDSILSVCIFYLFVLLLITGSYFAIIAYQIQKPKDKQGN